MKPRIRPHLVESSLEAELIASDRAETEDEPVDVPAPRPPGVPLSKPAPEDDPDWAEAAEAMEELQEHLDGAPFSEAFHESFRKPARVELFENIGLDYSEYCDCCETCQETCCQGVAAGPNWECELRCECENLEHPTTEAELQEAARRDGDFDLYDLIASAHHDPVAQQRVSAMLARTGVPPKPLCFGPRTGLKDEMVAELDAIQLRTVLAARMVC